MPGFGSGEKGINMTGEISTTRNGEFSTISYSRTISFVNSGKVQFFDGIRNEIC